MLLENIHYTILEIKLFFPSGLKKPFPVPIVIIVSLLGIYH